MTPHEILGPVQILNDDNTPAEPPSFGVVVKGADGQILQDVAFQGVDPERDAEHYIAFLNRLTWTVIPGARPPAPPRQQSLPGVR